MNSEQNKYRWILLTGIIIIAVSYMVIGALLPAHVFWISDGGNKAIIVQNIERTGSDSINYPAQRYDKLKDYFPDSVFHFNKRGNKIHSIFSCYFPRMSVPLFKAMGWSGLYILPMLCGLCLLVISILLVKRLKLPPLCELSLPLLAFATPLFFYSLTFWEMTPAVLLSTIAIMLLFKDEKHFSPNIIQCFCCGFILGLAVILREEAYVLSTSVLLALFFSRKRFHKLLPCGFGLALPVFPLWLFQLLRHGHILGLHGSTYHSHNTASQGFNLITFLLQKLNGYFIYLFKLNSMSFEWQWYYLPLLLPVFAAVAAGLYYKHYRHGRTAKTIILAAAVVSTSILTVMLWINKSPVLNSIFTVGFLTSSPLLLPGVISLRPLLFTRRYGIGYLTLISITFCLLLPPVLSQNDMGVIWGARHFLFLYPIMLPLSIYAVAHTFNLHKHKISVIILLMLCLISFAIQIRGIHNLFMMKNNMSKLNHQIAKNTGKLIISDIYWLVPMVPELYFQKQFMQFKSGKQMVSLVKQLKRHGVNNFSMILSKNPHYRRAEAKDWNKVSRILKISRPIQVHLPGADFMDVFIVPCEIVQPQ
ncbi:MAG: hypothetical protein GY750_03870 [Lentisphaerae bacterium]|nr:hypothetical protein [Lentisphaerota bacterium]MCP4100551.1 hypothetical protein [Lentisphaerota bacterium]